MLWERKLKLILSLSVLSSLTFLFFNYNVEIKGIPTYFLLIGVVIGALVSIYNVLIDYKTMNSRPNDWEFILLKKSLESKKNVRYRNKWLSIICLIFILYIAIIEKNGFFALLSIGCIYGLINLIFKKAYLDL